MFQVLIAAMTLLNQPHDGIFNSQPIEIQLKAEPGKMLRISVDEKPHFTLPTKGGTMEFSLPYSISEGEHVLRAFYVKDDFAERGELLTDLFYYKKETPKLQFDPQKPYLTYNEPLGKYKHGQPVYVDYLLSNCVLSSSGYRVKVTLDGHDIAEMSSWVAFPIHGLSKGDHKLTLELIDSYDKPVNNQFTKLTRKFVIN